ncbi:hypothetical protein RF11_12325 [Thelohanellus kitauei]|uniref:Tc1-like transposase DDE domain-containing protein n=1 Tax=Thelohanellus kitauei TaxID=669202 RepID=A0A0C2MUE3_THEKT|nr:hypothetical protein RF11_12325 [Thelohanellus kitauei]
MDYVRFNHANPEFFDIYPYHIQKFPGYSPFLNPYEEVFFQAKTLLRGINILRSTNDLIQRMTNACTLVTSNVNKLYWTLKFSISIPYWKESSIEIKTILLFLFFK